MPHRTAAVPNCRARPRPGVLGLLVLALLGAGCAPRATVERRRPAPYGLGAARALSLVQLTGRPDLQDLLRDRLRREATAEDWWHFRDRTRESIALFAAGSGGRSIAGERPDPGEAYVRLDAYDATVYREADADAAPPPAGPPTSGRGRVRLRFAATVVDSDGRVVMGDREYAGTATGALATRHDRRDLVAEAAEEGVEAFLRDITPRRVREGIALDVEAEDLQPVAELVDRGAYALARERLQRLRRAHPRRADIVYNLAVLTDARGEYRAALDLYEKALRLGYKDLYVRSRDACRRRLREREALESR
jgi:tetratricopeptide (TPR) repeat protein